MKMGRRQQEEITKKVCQIEERFLLSEKSPTWSRHLFTANAVEFLGVAGISDQVVIFPPL